MTAKEALARGGRTFYLASRLLPPRMRDEAAELYAFCRRMDDLADNGRADGRGALDRAVCVLRTDPLGPEAEEAGWPTALELRHPGISQVALTLAEALAADAGPRRIADEDALLAYAFGVAGTVGLMMCRILGAPPSGARAASHLGIAMQLTNIARDIREDWERDRVYLPATWIAPEAIESALRGGAGKALADALHSLLRLADSYYKSAGEGMRLLPLRARAAILTAAACYREIGVEVGRDPARSWAVRTVVAGPRKAALVARSLAVAPVYSIRRPAA